MPQAEQVSKLTGLPSRDQKRPLGHLSHIIGGLLPYREGYPRSIIHQVEFCPKDVEPRQRLDAVIVPTSRIPTHLDKAARVAQMANTPVIYLCSQDATPSGVMDFLKEKGIDTTNTIAIQLPDNYQLPKLHLATDKFPIPGYTKRDLALKRNLGIALAHLVGWDTVLFLDDDVSGLTQQNLNEALYDFEIHDDRRIVGWRYSKDSSVVLHAYDYAGGNKDSFIGGGALMVRIDDQTAFFPDIYNEDWLMIAANIVSGGARTVATEGILQQVQKNPFSRAAARTEEFGDIFAEGIFHMLYDDRELQNDWNFSVERWKNIEYERNILIESLITAYFKLINEEINPSDTMSSKKIFDALIAAWNTHQKNWPQLLSSYMKKWNKDIPVWQKWLKNLTPENQLPVAAALRRLNLHKAEISGSLETNSQDSLNTILVYP